MDFSKWRKFAKVLSSPIGRIQLPAAESPDHSIPAVYKYLDRCRVERILPHPNEILRRLIPGTANLRPTLCELISVVY